MRLPTFSAPDDVQRAFLPRLLSKSRGSPVSLQTPRPEGRVVDRLQRKYMSCAGETRDESSFNRG